jgi:hypothetical protein
MNTFNSIQAFSSNANIYGYTPILNRLSTQGKTDMIGTTLKSGAFGVKLLNSGYTGAIIQIKVGTSTSNFYAPTNGTTGVNNLTTGSGGSGTTLANFITNNGNGIPYVTIWYDQTGNNNYASASGNPTFNTTNNEVDFTNGYFTLGDNAFPQGNTGYTYLFKLNNVTNQTNGNCMYSGGSSSNNLYCSSAINYPGASRIYWNQWSNNDFWYSGSSYSALVNGTIIADCYTGSGTGALAGGRNFYINNSLLTTNLAQGGANANARNQSSGNNFIGHSFSGSFGNYTGTLAYFYWSNSLMSSGDIGILGTT